MQNDQLSVTLVNHLQGRIRYFKRNLSLKKRKKSDGIMLCQQSPHKVLASVGAAEFPSLPGLQSTCPEERSSVA